MSPKQKILPLIIFILFSAVIYLLFIKQIIYPTIIPMVANSNINLFADWSVIINANICDEKGYDVFLDNPCDYWGRKHIYGQILLYLPYMKEFPKFYFFYFPLLLNFLFLWIIVSNLFTYKNKKKFFFLLFFIINVPVLLAIERANIDIIIFIFTFLIARNKNKITNYFLIILSTISKFYPICLGIIFFFEKKLKNILLNLIILFLIILLIFFFQIDSFNKIFSNLQQFSGYGFGIYEFSFIGGVRFINFLKIDIEGSNYSWIKFVILFLFLLLPIILTNLFYKKKIYSNSDITNLFIENTFENRLYILSSILIILCYFSFSNFIYREIFLLGLLPWLLQKEKNIKSNNFLTFYFYILFFKFFITSLLVYISKNGILPSYEPIFVILKHSLDFYVISIVAHIFLFSFIIFFKKKFKTSSN